MRAKTVATKVTKSAGRPMTELAVEIVPCPLQDQDAQELQAFLLPLIANLDPPFNGDVELEVEIASETVLANGGYVPPSLLHGAGVPGCRQSGTYGDG